MACSASAVRPSASRQNARYCSIELTSSSGRLESGSRFSIASASSYAAEAYRSRAAAMDSCPATSLADISSRAATIPNTRRAMTILLLLPQVHAHTNRRLERHGRGVLLFAKLGMAEQNLVRADREREVADRRFTDAVAVNPDFRPGQRVDRDAALRPIELHRRRLASGHLHGA